MSYLKSFFNELKRRNIYKVAIAYGITGWVIVQMASIAADAFGAPGWVMKMIITVVLLGFPVAIILAWAFEITPNGIKRTQETPGTKSFQGGKKLKYGFICLLAAGALFLLSNKLWLTKTSVASEVQPTTTAIPSVAVLPFEDFSKEGNQEWFADGLTEEILNSLARLQGLKVAARTSSFHFKNTNLPIPQIADTLGVDHIVEGSVRRVGDDMRITAQLIRAEDGFHLWSKTYKRKVDDVFEVQEDISENIATALDIYLDEQKREKMFAFGTHNVDAYEAYLKGRNIYEELHQVSGRLDELFELTVPWFTKAIQLDPDFAAPYYYLNDPYVHYILNYPENKVDTLTVEKAQERMLYYLKQAIEYTKDPGLRLMYRFERTFLSENWSEIPELVQQLKESANAQRAFAMLGGGWTGTLLSITGHAKLQYEVSNKALKLDPLDLGLTASRIQALICFASLDSVMQAINEFKLKGQYAAEISYVEFFVYLRDGQIEKAGLVAQNSNGIKRIMYNVLLRAVRGNEAEAISGFETFPKEFKNSFSSALIHYALGNIEKANSLAARLDSTAFGPIKLLKASAVYTVGILPFELKATPNLAARLQEAGVEVKPVQWGSVTFPQIVQKEM
ncbi:MAG TPA: hypothetical protein VFG39_01430 [Balneolaceae bacterium]|nr:hypothetical protein [Balneolaceae bacterium]